jgi:hypothetical protein
MTEIEYLLKQNDETRQGQIAALVGGVKTFEDYQFIRGVIRGLDIADSNLIALADRLTKDENDE